MNSSNIRFESDVAYLYNAACLCMDEASGHDGIKQVAPLFASIPYNRDTIQSLKALEADLFGKFPDLVAFGRLRAKKAYQSQKNTITKPSYIGRLKNFCDRSINQIENMIEIATREPASGGLCFSIFSPEDLLRRRRPGYVPCLISGSLLLHESELQLNVFFRSQSVVEFAIYDLIFLRTLQDEVLARLKSRGALSNDVQPGNLNMFMGRVFIHRRLLKRKDGSFIRRGEIIENWISVVYMHLINC